MNLTLAKKLVYIYATLHTIFTWLIMPTVLTVILLITAENSEVRRWTFLYLPIFEVISIGMTCTIINTYYYFSHKRPLNHNIVRWLSQGYVWLVYGLRTQNIDGDTL